MKFLHRDANGMTVELDVVGFSNVAVKNTPVSIDQLDHAIGEVCVTAFNVSDGVDERFADVDDLLIKIPVIFVHNDGFYDIFVNRTETALGTHSIFTNAY